MPGVLVIVVSVVTMLLTSMAVVREREIGTMEQIMVTPITPAEFILGKTMPFALIGFIDVALVTLIGGFWFEVPIRGNLALLFFATGLYLMTMLGIGLFISTVSQTQQQAMISTFFFFFPAMLLSGFAFPIANMPEPVQWLTLFDPLRYFLVIVRAIFLKRRGHGNPLAADAGFGLNGRVHALTGGKAVSQDTVAIWQSFTRHQLRVVNGYEIFNKYLAFLVLSWDNIRMKM